MNAYLTAISLVLFITSLAAAITLLANPSVFRVPIWLKIMAYMGFIFDLAGGMLVFGEVALGWPRAFLEAGASLVMTSGSWTMILFIYVHAVVIPQHRKAG
jgi:hypothetical protein